MAGEPQAALPAAPPLGWGAKGGSRGSGEKSPPQPPFPPQKAREPMQNLQGALHSGVWGTPASSLRAHRLPRASFFSSKQVCGSPAACPPFHALTVEGGAPPPPRTWPPSLSPTWMYAIFARATHSGPGIAPPQPLCPRQQERGERARGRGRKGSRVAPDVTGVADERRPPLRRPPRPCLSRRAGSRSAGRLAGWELGCPGPPPRPPLLSRAPPEALPRLE